MKDTVGNIVAECVSVHCFINESGKPVRLAKEFPELYNVLMELSEAE
jgi:acyl-CoA thioesterase FadM